MKFVLSHLLSRPDIEVVYVKPPSGLSRRLLRYEHQTTKSTMTAEFTEPGDIESLFLYAFHQMYELSSRASQRAQ